MLTNIKAVIFDLDGTLIDSMWIWEQIDIDYFNKIGLPMPLNLKDEINHLSFHDTAVYFKNTFGIKKSVDEICNEWNLMALDYYSNKVSLKPGALNFIKKLSVNNIKIALATSNSKTLLEAALNHTGIMEYFDVITTTGEVNNGKNHPDVYLLAANKLQTSPNECLVFEDILEAIQGAKLAKMKVCAVYDKYSSYNKAKILCASDYYIDNYNDIDLNYTNGTSRSEL